MQSIPNGGSAVIVGSSGGIGAALYSKLKTIDRFASVVGFSRSGENPIDFSEEESIARAAEQMANAAPLRLLICATGFLHDRSFGPEKSIRQISAEHMRQAFEINTIGPALVLKHFAPLVPQDGKAVLAVLSAKVGSISDNHLGGWYGYRASKAALNQIVRTASIELRRRRPELICLALHPGTVDTPLSAPFAKAGLNVASPQLAAARLLTCIDEANPEQSGQFLDRSGAPLPW